MGSIYNHTTGTPIPIVTKKTHHRFGDSLITTTMWSLRLTSFLTKALMTNRQRELDLERKWELYRLDVVERMPDSSYKTAVLAGIAHKLRMLDQMNAASLG